MTGASQTSIDHYKTLDAGEWYARIKAVMRRDPDRAWCIADMAKELQAEKSTISARLNELCDYREIEYVGDMRSRSTGVKAKHYKLTMQPALL